MSKEFSGEGQSYDPSITQGDVVQSSPRTKSDNPTHYTPLGEMTNEEILAQSGTLAGGVADPTGARRGTVPAMTGQTDPVFGKKFAIGDRAYHKKKQKEVEIKDLSASGKAYCVTDEGGTFWALQENLVKL